MTVQIELTQEEFELAKDYASKNGLSLEKVMKNVFFEKVEEDIDIALADSAIKEYKKNPKTYSHEEVKKLLN